MSNYADLWLGYSEKKNNRDCKALKNITLAGAPEDDKVAINAAAGHAGYRSRDHVRSI